MPRIPKPWLREQTQSWYVKIDGVQHPLGKDNKEAERKYHRLMAGEGISISQPDLPMIGLVEQFLADAARDCTAKTCAGYRGFLDDFAGRYPRLKPSEIAPRHVKAWLHAERKRPWVQNTQRSAITVLKRLLNWATENRLIRANPIADLERPAAVCRERILESSERERILAWYPEGDVFRDLLIALAESGCRPGEAIRVTAADIDFEAGTWTMRGKTTRRTGKDRVIYMTATLATLARGLCERHPSGPIFRNEDGNEWTLQAINCRFRRKRNRKSDRLDGGITAYVYRPSWATDALENGVPDATVAELMGHSGTAMLHKHYSKLREKRAHLRNAAEAAVEKKKPPAPPG